MFLWIGLGCAWEGSVCMLGVYVVREERKGWGEMIFVNSVAGDELGVLVWLLLGGVASLLVLPCFCSSWN